MTTPAVGVDMVTIARIAELRRRRPEFTRRCFTDAEQRYCAERDERWAARWAAKEAVRKLAGASGMPLPAWHDIEVVRQAGGSVEARVRGWMSPAALSLSHESGFAIAVAAGDPGPAPDVTGIRLPDRPDESHKGTYGTVVVVAGSRSYSGAAVLCGLGAARGGAGLVRLHVPECAFAAVAARCVEVMPFADAADGDGFAPAAAETILRDARRARALAVGPGLGASDPVAALVAGLLGGITQPAVLDADALNVIASHSIDVRHVGVPLVLTPHPGEMGRLAGISADEVNDDRAGVALDVAQRTGAVVVLKGAHTVIAGPDGRVETDPRATSALATGGSGDVLTGLIAALLAQGLAAFDAARAGVAIHAEAGVRLARRLGRAGVLAGDIAAELPAAQESLRRALEHRPA